MRADLDPREGWDAKEWEIENALSNRKRFVSVAKAIEHTPSIELAESALRELQTKRRTYTAARTALDEAAANFDGAEAELAAAREANQAGAPDEKGALTLFAAIVTAEARCRYFLREFEQKRAVAYAARTSLAFESAVGTSGQVLTETVGYVTKLLEYTRAEGAFAAAEEDGRRSNSDKSQWWPICEKMARDDAKPKFAALRERDERWDREGRLPVKPSPTLADLDECFARRRAGFKAQKAKIEGELAKMRGELESMKEAQ